MSKAKKRRNKVYRPRAANPAGGLVALLAISDRGELASPLQESQLTDLGLAYWLSFENLCTGDATEEHWSCVVCALNVAMALCEAGIGGEEEDDLRLALDGAFRAKIRSARTGNFRLDGDAMRDITAALHTHDEQMKLATRAEVTTALQLVHRRVQEGNVYREAA